MKIKLFQGIVGSSKWSSTCYCTASGKSSTEGAIYREERGSGEDKAIEAHVCASADLDEFPLVLKSPAKISTWRAADGRAGVRS